MATLISGLTEYVTNTVISSSVCNGNNDIIQTAHNTHAAAATGEHGVTGTAFADTDSTQTFENKTMTSPTINNGELAGYKLNALYKGEGEDYTITNDDKVSIIICSPGTSDLTITLPTLADNQERVITVFYQGADQARNVIIDGEGAETINGAATYSLTAQYHSATIIAGSSEWSLINKIA